MQSLTWYFNRLRRMSAGELFHRTVRSGRNVVSRMTPTVPAVPPPAGPLRWPEPWLRAPANVEIRDYRKAAELILRGRYSIFDLDDVELDRPPHWNRDPLTGICAPARRADALDYRDQRVVGNIKYLWEPNRHLHLVTLAQAYALTGEEPFGAEIRRQIESWIEQCPYPYGPNWASSLELGIRLINWSICWQLVGGASSPIFDEDGGRRFRDAWLHSVFLHARHIVLNLSRFSSANNHLIGEAAGVFVAASTWPCWPRLVGWGHRCKLVLQDEALKQNAPDGGNREQAFSYQQFVLDFLLMAGLAARTNRADFPAEYWTRIEAMIDFLASMMDVAGHVPMVGDADDGYVVRLSAGPKTCPYRSLAATGALLFERADLLAKAGHLDDKSKWLLGAADSEQRFASLAARPATRYAPKRAFPDSGYFVLGDRFNTTEEIRLVVDAGPLGYLSLAAHGHADALSLVLNVGGEEILIDPGTYCYHTDPAWRGYFRGTAAHNTVSVDGEDQSIQRGNFMWSNHARSRLLEFSPDGSPQIFAGTHDGYCRLKDPVVHQREICYDPKQREFEIRDTLDCSGAHEVVRHWHFAEQLVPETDGDACAVRTSSWKVLLAPLEALQGTEIVNGAIDPPGGWVSRSFGNKVAAFSVRWRNGIVGKTVLRTRLTCRAR